MTTSTAPSQATAEGVVRAHHAEMAPFARRAPSGIPLLRVTAVELRKMFDTRSGLWLLASLGLAAVIASGAIIAWAPAEQFTHGQFTLAIGMPMTVILPTLAILSVTTEWSQRTGLTTFALVPHRGRILFAKAIAAVMVTVPATVVAFAIGALGNVVGAALGGVTPVWDQGWADVGSFALGQTLLLLVGFGLGALVRNSAGAVVAYMLYAFVMPGLLAFLALNQAWFADARRWVDLKYNQDALLRGDIAGDQWTHLAVTAVLWIVLPLVAAVLDVLRSEVK